MSELALQLIREAKEKRATSLDLGNCGLTELPDELFELVWLEELILGNSLIPQNEGQENVFMALPPEIKRLNALKKLDIQGGYSTIPLTDLNPLRDLKKLQALYLSDTQVSDLSPLKDLVKLQTLDLRNTQVSDLSPLKDLNQLQLLYISDTQVRDLSPLKGLSQLQTLYMYSTQVINLGPLQDLSQLQRLFMGHTQVSNLSALKDLVQLEWLELKNTQIKDIKPLEALVHLKTLYLNNTQVSVIEPLKDLVQLEWLELKNTQIKDIKPLEALVHLKTLYLNNTQVSVIEPLKDLVQLETLELNNTQVSVIEPLKDLVQLETLSLVNTQVSVIKPLRDLLQLRTLYLNGSQVSDIGVLKDLSQLQTLTLNGTQVSNISLLKPLKKLIHLMVSGCPIPYIPKEITQQIDCARDLKAYWQEIDQSQAETNNQLKVMFLGNGCVGKTTLLHWFIDNSFKDLSLESGRTHGIIIQPWLFQENGMLANFWDFGGQEVYHATHRLFLGSRTLYLLVWATETPEQQQEERHPPQYWLDMIADIGGKQERSRVIVVQNVFEGQAVQNMLSNEELEAYTARGLDITPLSVDAKKGTNVRTFKAQVEEAAAQLLETYVEELPETWVNIRKAVAAHRAGEEKTMPWGTFVKICETCGLITDPATVLGYLHRAGEVFHYPNQFDNQIILDQQWALKAVYAILKKDKIARYKGIFQLEDLLEIWQSGHPDLSLEEAKVFLSFMLGNKILFHTEKDGAQGNENPEFVVPQLLPTEKPAMWKLWEDIPDVLSQRIEYAFLHRDIIERFMVQTAYLSQEKSWWRNGLFIDFEGGKAVVEVVELPESNRKFIQIRCAGAAKEKLLETIREEFNKIRALDKAKEYRLQHGEWQPWSATTTLRNDEKSGFPERDDRLDKMEAILQKISSFVEKNATNMETVSLKAHLKKLVFNAKRREAIEALYDWSSKNDDSLNNEVIGVSARLNSLETEINGGSIYAEDAKVSMAKITNSINYLIDQVPDAVTVQVSAAPAVPPKHEEPPAPPPAKVEILMLTANPAGTTKLNLDKEHSIITIELQENQDRYNLIVKKAVDRGEFQKFIEANKPYILHFSGHGEPGGADGGIKVQNDEKNGSTLIPPSGLDALFEYFNEENIAINTVVLNACYSEEQAKAIAAHVPYVIGTTVALPDTQAIAFSVGFYYKLVAASTLNIEQAFRSGRTQARAAGAAKSDFVLYKNNQKLDL